MGEDDPDARGDAEPTCDGAEPTRDGAEPTRDGVEPTRDGPAASNDDAEPILVDEEGILDEAAGSLDAPLAAVVRKRVADAAIRGIRAEGVYDESRRVLERDDETIEVPVDSPPGRTDVLDVVRQHHAEARVTGLADLLRERGFTEAEIEAVPASWAVVGSVVTVAFGDCPRREAVGEALLELHGNAATVVARGGIAGPHREPDITVVAGEGDTETVHVEHGTRYALDLAEVMFSPGNKAERARMGEVVADDVGPTPESGRDGAAEGRPGQADVLDMFAGIGYFALPMARAGARVTAIERNPVAFRYLLENARLNDVTDHLEPYRGDCRDVVDRLTAEGPVADRVVMGYYDAADYLEVAIPAVRSGGVVHLHGAVPEPELWDRPLEAIASEADRRGRDHEVLDRRTVKTHSEGVAHVVVDVRVQ